LGRENKVPGVNLQVFLLFEMFFESKLLEYWRSILSLKVAFLDIPWRSQGYFSVLVQQSL